MVDAQPGIRSQLLNLLSMREHSQKELMDKLSAKSLSAEAITKEIIYLQEIGLQSDARFAAAFARMRVRQGKGPLIINQELLSKGISKELIIDTINELDIEWEQLARETRERKFGEEIPVEPKLKAKQLRFLAGRGFNASQAYAAIAASCDNDGY
jgi:regulatory protein